MQQRRVSSGGKKIWSVLTSMRTALVILLVLAGLAVFGSLIPQGEPLPYYYQAYGTIRAKLIIFLQLNDIFHAWLFLSVCFLLALSLLACSWRRLSPAWRLARQVKFMHQPEFYQRSALKEQTLVSADAPRVLEQINTWLRQRRYRVHIQEQKGNLYFDAQKASWAGFGSILTHIGIVVIIIGAVYGGLTGFDTYIHVPEKEQVYVEQGDFAVVLNDFNVDYYDNYLPKQYYSNVTIMQNNKPALQQVLSVNQPVTFHGTKLYQFNYGWVLDAMVQGYGLQKNITLYDRELTPLMGDLNIRAFFYPDYVEDEAGHPATRTPLPHYPRVVCAVYQGTQLISFDLVQFGQSVQIPVGGNEQIAVTFSGYRYFTGLQVAKDPGTPIVYAGAIIVMLGLAISFYVWQRRIWGMLTFGPGGTSVLLAGLATRYPVRLAKEMNQLVNWLNKDEGDEQ